MTYECYIFNIMINNYFDDGRKVSEYIISSIMDEKYTSKHS